MSDEITCLQKSSRCSHALKTNCLLAGWLRLMGGMCNISLPWQHHDDDEENDTMQFVRACKMDNFRAKEKKHTGNCASNKYNVYVRFTTHQSRKIYAIRIWGGVTVVYIMEWSETFMHTVYFYCKFGKKIFSKCSYNIIFCICTLYLKKAEIWQTNNKSSKRYD